MPRSLDNGRGQILGKLLALLDMPTAVGPGDTGMTEDSLEVTSGQPGHCAP